MLYKYFILINRSSSNVTKIQEINTTQDEQKNYEISNEKEDSLLDDTPPITKSVVSKSKHISIKSIYIYKILFTK